MKKRYNYLQDGKAVEEILKHKWIESQKHGRDIGFATAALDWISKYGEAWRLHHEQEYRQHVQHLDNLIERRKYRRFKNKLPAKIIHSNKEHSIIIKDINYFDICFFSKAEISSAPTLTLKINSDNSSNPLTFTAALKLKKSILLENQQVANLPYLNIARFEEHSQQELVKHKNVFFN